MSKHTPGPWIATTKPEQDNRVFFIHHDDGSGYISPLVIATIYSGGNENAVHDARLIAAVPELLEALKKLADAVDSGDVGGQSIGALNAYRVIAKATGKS